MHEISHYPKALKRPIYISFMTEIVDLFNDHLIDHSQKKRRGGEREKELICKRHCSDYSTTPCMLTLAQNNIETILH